MFPLAENPKVSIIMPTYNRADYIIASIESIQGQTWTNWELIIIDDGSEDNTEEIVSKINDGRISFFKKSRTAMVSKLKNSGLKKAGGELIAFLDSDDLWHPSKLEKQVKALKEFPGAGFCMTGGYNFKKLNEPLEYFYKQKEGNRYGNIFISMFQSEIAGFTQALMVRKECIEIAGGFKESSVITMNDIDFIIHLALHFDAVILYEPLVYRRLHESNYIHSAWEKSYNEGIAIIKEYKAHLPLSVAKKAMFRLYINFGEKCLLYKQRKKAITNFFHAWKNNPFTLVPLKKIGKAIIQR